MKESRHANFGAIQAIFLQLSWSQHKLAHSCQGRGQRSNGAINRNKHLFRSFCRGISNLVTPSLTVAELFQKENGIKGWDRGGRRKFYLRAELIKCIDPNEGEALKRGREGGRREGGYRLIVSVFWLSTTETQAPVTSHFR